MSDVLCSFIIPAFNAEKTIGECLRSIFAQKSDHAFEVIVVDNNSSDCTFEIVSRFPVKYIKETKQGRSHARNAGIREAQGMFIAFIDSDSVIEESWLAITSNRIQGYPGIGAVQGRIRLKYHACTPKSLVTLSKMDVMFKQLKHTNRGILISDCDLEKETLHPLVNTAACLYLKTALLEVGGFDPKFGRLEDGDLSERVMRSGYALASCCETLSWKYETASWRTYIKEKLKDHFYLVRFLYIYDERTSALSYLKAIPRIIKTHVAEKGQKEKLVLFVRMLITVFGYLIRSVAAIYVRAISPQGLPSQLKHDLNLPDQQHCRRIYLRNYLMKINLLDRNVSLCKKTFVSEQR